MENNNYSFSDFTEINGKKITLVRLNREHISPLAKALFKKDGFLKFIVTCKVHLKSKKIFNAPIRF
jgi:hypothetical protein